MKLLHVVLFIMLMIPFFNSSACLNEFGTDQHGNQVEFAHAKFPYITRFDSSRIAQKITELQKKLKEKYSYQTHSNVAVHILKSGSYAEALKTFIELNEKFPDNYTICANLGTAYELNGNNDSAIYYIKKAMKLNPRSHRGSEWVHVKILEVKIHLRKDPHWLKNHSVLNLQMDSLPKLRKYSFPWQKTFDSLLHVRYQLNERMPFTPVPDPILSAVLSELGDAYTHFSIEDSYVLYHLASVFYDGENKVLQKKILLTEGWLNRYKIKKPDLKKIIAPLKEQAAPKDNMSKKNQPDNPAKVISNFPPEKNTEDAVRAQSTAREKAIGEENLSWLLWGLLPVLISIVYILYRNNKMKKQ